MRAIWLAAALSVVPGCSSRSSRDVHADGGGGSGGGGGSSGTGSGGSSGTGSGGASGSAGVMDGGAGDAAVVTGPLSFDPASIEFRGGESAQARVRFAPQAGFDGTLEVTLSVQDAEGAAAVGGVTVEPTTFLLSASVNEGSFTVRAPVGAVQAAFVVRAEAVPSGAGEALSAALPVTIMGNPGELDTTFGNGVGYVDIQPQGNCNAEGVVALADGRFLVVGQALSSNLLIARFQANGELDTTYGPDGTGMLLDPNQVFIRANPILLGDGALLVAFDTGQINLARVLESGSLDPSWGQGGVLPQTDIRAGNQIGFAVDPDGRILLGGTASDPSTNDQIAVVRRLLPDGSIDASFAGDGTVEINLGGPLGGASSGYVEALALQSNGNIVAVGGTYISSGLPITGDYQYAFRVQSNGQPDSTFGSQGVRLTKFGTNEFGNYETAYSVAIQTQAPNAGKPVVAGYFRQNADTAILLSLTRHQANGELDGTFLNGGKGTRDLPNSVEDAPGQLLIQPDDGWVTHVDSFQGRATSFLVARFTAAGALDTSWGTGGIATAVPGRAFGMAESGRRLIVVGSAQPSPDPMQSARIARYWLR